MDFSSLPWERINQSVVPNCIEHQWGYPLSLKTIMYWQRKSPKGEYFLVSKKSGDIKAILDLCSELCHHCCPHWLRKSLQNTSPDAAAGENVSVSSSVLLLWTFFRYMNVVPTSHTWACWAAPEPPDSIWCAKSLQSAYILHSFRLLHCLQCIHRSPIDRPFLLIIICGEQVSWFGSLVLVTSCFIL